LNDITQIKLTETIRTFSKSTLARIEKNSIDPSVSDVVEICKFFNASTDWLLTGKGGINNEKGEFLTIDENEFINKYRKLKKIDKIRVLERMQTLIETYEEKHLKQAKRVKVKVYELLVSAGFGTYIGDIGSEYDVLEFDEDEVPPRADYGLGVRGDSMAPFINDGDTVWVKEQCEVDNGNIGIFVIDDEAFCKKLEIKYGSRGQLRQIRLLSLNPKYEPIVIKEHNKFRTLGKVLNKPKP